MSIWDLIIEDVEEGAYYTRELPNYGAVICSEDPFNYDFGVVELPKDTNGYWFITPWENNEIRAGIVNERLTILGELMRPSGADFALLKKFLAPTLDRIKAENSYKKTVTRVPFKEDKQETYMSHFDELKSLHMDVAKTEFQTQVGKVILSNAKKMLKKQITNPFLSGFVNSAYFGIVAMSIAKYVVSMTGQSNKHVDWAIEAGMRAAYAEVGEKLNPSEFVAKLMKNVPEEETD